MSFPIVHFTLLEFFMKLIYFAYQMKKLKIGTNQLYSSGNQFKNEININLKWVFFIQTCLNSILLQINSNFLTNFVHSVKVHKQSHASLVLFSVNFYKKVQSGEWLCGFCCQAVYCPKQFSIWKTGNFYLTVQNL